VAPQTKALNKKYISTELFMVTSMMNLRGAVSGLLLIFLSGFSGVLTATTVTYDFEGCNISEVDCTPSVLGSLTFNSPPASATDGWSIGTGQESEIVSFSWELIGTIDLSTTAIAGVITSNSGAELDAGGFNTALSPPKWTLTFGTAPGIDTVIYSPLPGCGSCVFEGDWVVTSGPPAIVPVPAAVWLFGSGILGLIGIAKRKSS
jgi:hypothetical protein